MYYFTDKVGCFEISLGYSKNNMLLILLRLYVDSLFMEFLELIQVKSIRKK